MFNIDLHKILKSKNREFTLSFQADFLVGKTNVIYGRSGSGKTTILRILAGLQTSDSGLIEYNGGSWFSSKEQINIPVQHRPVGMLFQEASLFPNMTVRSNLEYATGKELTSETIELCEKTGVNELMSMMPENLSGGEKQRVSLIRALCQNPEVLCLDEPFSALDDESIQDLVEALKTAQEKHNTTYVIATHRREIGRLIGDMEFSI